MTWSDVTVFLMAAGYFATFVYLLASYARELAREERSRAETSSEGTRS